MNTLHTCTETLLMYGESSMYGRLNVCSSGLSILKKRLISRHFTDVFAPVW